VRKVDNLPPSCAIVTKSGNLNFLEPSGPVQVCNGTALPFLLCMFCFVYCFHRANWHTSAILTEIFLCFFLVRQMPGYNLQRRGTARTLPKLIVLFCVLFMCKCLLHYCQWVSAQLQLTNTSVCVGYSAGMQRDPSMGLLSCYLPV